MSEALPYVVFVGSVAAVFMGIGIKIALERDSKEPALLTQIPISTKCGTSSPSVSGSLSAPITEEDEVGNSRKVEGPKDSVGSDGNVIVTAERSESKRRKRRRKIGKRLERKIVRLYRRGKSPKEIAEELGISTSTVYRKLRKLVSVKS